MMMEEADSFQDSLSGLEAAVAHLADLHAENIEEPPEHASNAAREKRRYPVGYMRIVWILLGRYMREVMGRQVTQEISLTLGVAANNVYNMVNTDFCIIFRPSTHSWG